MKILYLSFYFEPDLCAGSFRNTPLVNELSRQVSSDDLIHVITTMPNRYQSFTQKAPEYEEKDNLVIHRIALSQHKSGFIDQSLAFKIYFLKVLKITKNQDYDLIFASSSRLFTAFTGSIVSRRKKIPFYIDVRDIFVDTMQDVIKNPFIKYPLLAVLRIAENLTFKKANHINLISEGFKLYFSKYKNSTYSYYTNGIDNEFMSFPISTLDKIKSGQPNIITYAGNIGEGQGLEKIVPEAAIKLGLSYRFRIIGDGGKKLELEKKIAEKKISNIELIPPTNREAIIQYYQDSDYLFLHLNNYKAFEKVLPSKIFEYGASDKPIIAGVSGYAAEFIRKNLSNFVLFAPGDANELETKLKDYSFHYEKREEFKTKFNRESINKEMARSILNTLKMNSGVN